MRRYLFFLKDIIQYIVERIFKSRKYKNYVLMFHVVSDNKAEWYEDEYSISMKSFKVVVENLQKKGYQFITPNEIKNLSCKKSILLSFDDAFECIYYNVYPYLKQKNIPFITFQNLEFLNKDVYMKEYMIKEMKNYEGFMLGGHLLEHIRISEISKKQSLFSMIESKKKLEQIFNTRVDYMAYPYGSYSSIRMCDRRNAKKVGFLGAFGTVSLGVSERNINLFFIPRINVNENNYTHILERCDGNGN